MKVKQVSQICLVQQLFSMEFFYAKYTLPNIFWPRIALSIVEYILQIFKQGTLALNV